MTDNLTPNNASGSSTTLPAEIIEKIDADLSVLFDELDAVHGELSWNNFLSDFQVKAQTIRRILDRFYNSDLSTRRYLSHHLDEEWEQLRASYETLRSRFAGDKELNKRNGHHPYFS